MSRFMDGPAEGVEIVAQRAPMYLRVVQDQTTLRWDVLDQPDDTPSPSELVFVYKRVEGTGGVVFACTRSSRGGGRYEGADYRHVEVEGEQFRDTSAWRDWALSQPEARPTADAFSS